MKRTPLKRSLLAAKSALRQVGKRGAGLKAMDAVLRQIILKRDVTCRRCGRGKGEGRGFALQAAHIYGKGKYQALRYELLNVILLCQPCHYWWHSNGFGREVAPGLGEVRAWCLNTLGVEYMTELDYLTMPGVRSKPNRKLEMIALQQWAKGPAESLPGYMPEAERALKFMREKAPAPVAPSVESAAVVEDDEEEPESTEAAASGDGAAPLTEAPAPPPPTGFINEAMEAVNTERKAPEEPKAPNYADGSWEGFWQIVLQLRKATGRKIVLGGDSTQGKMYLVDQTVLQLIGYDVTKSHMVYDNGAIIVGKPELARIARLCLPLTGTGR